MSVNAAAVSLASARRNIRFKLLKLHLIEQMGLALAALTVETHGAFLQVTRRLSKRAELG